LYYHDPVATILLVEDEKIMRTLMRVALEKQDHEVLEAASSRRALALARSRAGTIDLVVAQLALPKMNGAELAEALRAERPGLRALLVARSAGAAPAGENVLRQPFDLGALVAAVEEQLGRPAGRRKPPARSTQRLRLRKAK
jgi:DNA-binding response OmpR family regulator